MIESGNTARKRSEPIPEAGTVRIVCYQVARLVRAMKLQMALADTSDALAEYAEFEGNDSKYNNNFSIGQRKGSRFYET